MLKPRIRFFNGFDGERWVCTGMRGFGTGWSPEIAYLKWKASRRDARMSGLGCARSKRLAAERRIAAREERRKLAAIRKPIPKIREDIYKVESKGLATFWERIFG